MYWWFWRWVGRLDWRYKNTTLGVLYLCWFPVLIWLLWEVATTSIPNSGFTYFAIRMILSNSGMSFPIYLKNVTTIQRRFFIDNSYPWSAGSSCSIAQNSGLTCSASGLTVSLWWGMRSRVSSWKKTNLQAAMQIAHQNIFSKQADYFYFYQYLIKKI